MPIRLLALILLLGAACAQAAAPKHKSAPPADTPATATQENIDVDAMARAKDAGSATTPDNTAPAPPATEADTAAPAAETLPTQDTAGAPAAAAEPTAAPATDAGTPPASTDSAPMERPAPLAPPSTPDAAEKRLAAGCESRATSLLDAAQKSDYAAATRDFDAKMRTGMPVPKFKQAWESLAQFGALTARGQSHPARSEGYIAVTIPLIFEKANLYAQITCGSDGRVAGFYVKPLEVPKS